MTPAQIVADPGASADQLEVAAREAEQSGAALIALRAWQRIVQLRPDHGVAWGSLATLHDERGDHARANVCRERAGMPIVVSSPRPEPLPGPGDAELVRFVRRFAGREDTHARMWKRGEELGWSPVPGVLTPELVRAHLAGEMTLGSYVLRVGGTAGWVVLDLDMVKEALFDARRATAARATVQAAAVGLAARLRELGLDALVEESGHKGFHVWLFFDPPLQGADAFALGRALSAMVGPATDVSVESFPKQPQVRPGGLGNLVKLPLGLHLRSGRRSRIWGIDGTPLDDPWPRLKSVADADPGLLPRVNPGLPPTTSATPPVPAGPAPRPWTAADFETEPQIAPVLSGCAMLRGVIHDALRDRRISREENLVLNHALGHLAAGPRAVNYVYDHIPGFAPEGRMGAAHRGQVIPCARVRQRLPVLAARVGCECTFDVPPGAYAHPLLHGGGPRTTQPTPPDETLARWARLELRAREIGAELDDARRDAVRVLERAPDHRWAGEGGDWVLDLQEEAAPIRWEAWPSSN